MLGPQLNGVETARLNRIGRASGDFRFFLTRATNVGQDMAVVDREEELLNQVRLWASNLKAYCAFDSELFRGK